MWRNSISISISISIALVVAACGGGGGSIPASQVATELSKATCHQLFRCCTSDELMQQALGATTEDQCVAIYGGFASIGFDVIVASIAAGRIDYDGDVMRTCIDSIASASCTEFSAQRGQDSLDMSSGCRDPFVGTLAAGAACSNDAECVSTYCSGDSIDLDGHVTMGVCKPAPTAGMPCDDDECTSGAWCNAGTCAAPKADGTACDLDDECASGTCSGSPGACASSAVCDGR
jgi:hypothetical protein